MLQKINKNNLSKKDCVSISLVIAFFLAFGWICPFYYITGIPCPGCFITRSIFALAKLNINEAIYYSAVGPCIPIFAIILLICHIFKQKQIFKILLFIFASIIILYWIYRLIFCFGHQPFIFNKNSLLGLILC
ncbi:MAG: DUF2752 domain-containing protein [Bifidobacteriaceae bacterium]|nr:DUF2752 domain-containing protein [Bifidobacteriaceae bacterium]